MGRPCQEKDKVNPHLKFKVSRFHENSWLDGRIDLDTLGFVWLGGWRVGRRESIGRMESVKDGDDYNNPSSCLVGRRDR